MAIAFFDERRPRDLLARAAASLMIPSASIKELVKGKWCRDCKNEYERLRRSNIEVRDKIRKQEKE